MIDFHGHFLPEIDDGAKDVSESFAMLSESLSQDVSLCYATPHCIIHHGDESISDFLSSREKSCKLLTDAAAESGVVLPEIKFGAEVYLDNDITQFPEYKKLCMGDTPYILLEFPRGKPNPNIYDWIYEMTLVGIKPLIAHVERYIEYDKMIDSLTELGAVYQVNASCFLDIFGRKLLKKILKKSNRVIIGSDMHNTKERKPNIKRAYDVSLSKFGKEITDKLFIENSRKYMK